MADTLSIPYVKARWFTKTNGRKVDLIVIHDMEAPETSDMAERIARMFATTSRQASAHYCVDDNSIVQCVYDKDVAYHAPGANSDGIGIEHAGYANQRADQWSDPFSSKMLEISAHLVAHLCEKFGIPKTYVDAAGLQAGKRGITTHDAVSKAFRKSDHWDPGPNFPMAKYIDMVRSHNTAAPAPAPAPMSPQEVRLVVNAPVVTILSHPSWNGGYIQIGADGGTFSFQAPNFGSLGATPLNAPIVDADVTPTGNGYVLLGADGGVFTFGDAVFAGGHGPEAENAPFVAIKVTPTGQGYWLTGRDGGVFSYGDAQYKGSVEYRG